MGAAFDTPGGVHNRTPDRIVFGAGASAGLADEVARLGARRALVVCTPGRAGQATTLAEALGPDHAGLLAEAVSQVPVELARRGREVAAERGADCLVAVGGGAATGLCKGIALESGLPIIAVPTTYSGSEMTGFCGITIDGVKVMHQDVRMLASTVVYDPELSLGLPRATTASSALNAMAHCVDSIYLPTLSPLLAPAALDGARTLSRALPAVLAAPEDLEARSELLRGAFLAGAALSGGFALQHAVAHVLGGSFGVEHGLAHALVLPHVAAVLEDELPGALAPVADAIGTDDLPRHLLDVLAGSGLPVRLSELGVTPDDVERAVSIVTSGATGEDGGPVPLSADVLRRVLDAALTGAGPEVVR